MMESVLSVPCKDGPEAQATDPASLDESDHLPQAGLAANAERSLAGEPWIFVASQVEL